MPLANSSRTDTRQTPAVNISTVRDFLHRRYTDADFKGYKNCITHWEDGESLSARVISSLVTTHTWVQASSLPAYIETHSGQLKKEEQVTNSIFWTCSLEQLAYDCLQWISFVSELFCMLLLIIFHCVVTVKLHNQILLCTFMWRRGVQFLTACTIMTNYK